MGSLIAQTSLLWLLGCSGNGLLVLMAQGRHRRTTLNPQLFTGVRVQGLRDVRVWQLFCPTSLLGFTWVCYQKQISAHDFGTLAL